MSEPLLICESADPDTIVYATGVALAYGDAPASAAGRTKAFDRRRRQAKKVVPHVLRWLESHRRGDAPCPAPNMERECERAVRAGLGPIQAWLLGQAVRLIVRMLIRWYFDGQSRAFRHAMQARRAGQ